MFSPSFGPGHNVDETIQHTCLPDLVDEWRHSECVRSPIPGGSSADQLGETLKMAAVYLFDLLSTLAPVRSRPERSSL